MFEADKRMKNIFVAFSAISAVSVLAAILISCGSSEVTQNFSAEDRFAMGMKKFGDGDYLEAISDFQNITLQFPGSSVADKAQYYIGESHFKRSEFLLASESYQTLRRTMPASPLVAVAQYKIALCYYNLSPTEPLDEKYLNKAIDEFQAFLEYYPKDENAPDADAKIKELKVRLAKRLFETAGLYMRMEYFRSATIYYDLVIEKYYDTEFAEPAYLGKAHSLISRNKYADAAKVIDKFLEKYPNSERKKDAESLRSEVQDHLRGNSSAAGLRP